MAKIFNEIIDNQNEIENQLHLKTNVNKVPLNEDYNWKTEDTIKESDWITGTTVRVGQSTSANNFLPTYLSISKELDFILDPKFIPFINVEVLTKKQPDLELLGVVPYIHEFYESDYVEIYGDGSNLIYKGTPQLKDYIYDEDDLIAGNFTEDYAKKAYYATIEYTLGGDEYKIGGLISEIIMVVDAGLSGGGNQNLDTYYLNTAPTNLVEAGYMRFTDMTESSVTGDWKKTETRYNTNPSPPPAEIPSTNTIGKTTASFNFDTHDEYYTFYLGTLYKKISGNWVLQGTGNYTINSVSHTITSRTITLNGYWIFWGPESRYTIGVSNVVPPEPDGSLQKKEIYNLPPHPYRYWTTITFKRNQDPHPEVTSVNSVVAGFETHQLIKLYKSTERAKDKYRLLVTGILAFKTLADQVSTSNIPVYNDVYTATGSNPGDKYTPSYNHTLKETKYYRADFVDVEYKIRISILNPYDFSDRKNYVI